MAGRRVNHLSTHHPDKLRETQMLRQTPDRSWNILLYRTKRLYNEPIKYLALINSPFKLPCPLSIPSEFRHVQNSNKNRLDIWRWTVLFQSHRGLPTADCSRNDFFQVPIKRPLFFLQTSTVGDHSCTVFFNFIQYHSFKKKKFSCLVNVKQSTRVSVPCALELNG